METFWEYAKAFLVGGTLCGIGQVLIDYTKLTPARILVAYVVAGVILGGLGWYQPFIDFAGAGRRCLLAKGVREAVDKDGLMGVLSGGLTASAPGITAAVVFGLFAALIFKPKDKGD